MAEKPRGNSPAPPETGNEAGRLARDDLGNITWEWKMDEDLLADDTFGGAERLRALVDPRLQLTEDDDDPLNPIRSNPKGLKSGYNPYNSGALGKDTWRKKKDLRELSTWIELRKKMAEKKGDE